MEDNIGLGRSYNLIKLKKYLNYEVSFSILYFLSFQIFIFLFIALAAALIFTPYMLYVLFKEDKKGWIVLFVIIVIVPAIVLTVTAILFSFSNPLLIISIGLFYFYFFLLRFSVNGWLREISMQNQIQLQKKKREEEMEIFMKQLD